MRCALRVVTAFMVSPSPNPNTGPNPNPNPEPNLSLALTPAGATRAVPGASRERAAWIRECRGARPAHRCAPLAPTPSPHNPRPHTPNLSQESHPPTLTLTPTLDQAS